MTKIKAYKAYENSIWFFDTDKSVNLPKNSKIINVTLNKNDISFICLVDTEAEEIFNEQNIKDIRRFGLYRFIDNIPHDKNNLVFIDKLNIDNTLYFLFEIIENI